MVQQSYRHWVHVAIACLGLAAGLAGAALSMMRNAQPRQDPPRPPAQATNFFEGYR